jgi:hypothetical protein
MAEERGVSETHEHVGTGSPGTVGNDRRRTGENRLTWEMPLGVVRGQLDEPGPRFVDVEGEADKEACRLERGQTCLGQKI